MKKQKVKFWQKMLLFGALLLFSPQLFSQVKGKVSDTSGMSIPGATIIEKGTKNGVVSDSDGKYQIQVSNQQKAVLVFSFVGLEEQEIPVAGKTTINVTLKESTTAIDEVVVVGYGTQKKESIVASIATISSAEIVQSPTSNLTAGLAGKMPGLTIMLKDGELGAENLQTFIRGQATMNSSSPLILVDGVERGINSIDPYDVESVSILKDASATAVFGVRGANGVILVTTKKGIVGKTQVTANSSYSLQTPTRLPKPLNAFDYVNLRNEVVRLDNPNNPPAFDDSVIEHLKNNDLTGYYMDRDFFGESFKKYTPMYKANVNVQGGTEKTKYFASVGYMSQGGPFKTVPNTEFGYDNSQRLDRFTYRANIDMQITKSLKAWMNLSGYLQDKNDPMIRGDLQDAATGVESSYFRMIAKMLDEPSLATSDFLPDGKTPTGFNMYGWLNQSGYKVATTNQVNSTVGFEQDMGFITKGLSARAIVSYDANNVHRRGFRQTPDEWASSLVKSPAGKDSVVYSLSKPGIELVPVLTQEQRNTFDLEASVNYNNKFGAHAVTGLLLYKQNQAIRDAQVPFNYVGIVGRATYNYAQRYLAELNFGMNGSEQFAEGRRFGFFPSVSLGWVLTQENFMKGISAVEFLKLRGSFGQVGNDNISNRRFIYVEDWVQGTGSGSYFNGTGNLPGLPNPVYENSMANPFVSWEVANKANIGIESSFKGGFEWDLDLFYEKRNSILITQLAVPRYMFGQLSMPPVNDGVMTNRGFETSFTHKKKFAKDLFIMNRISAAFARNVIEENNEAPFDKTYVYPYRQEGFSRGVIFGYDCLGYFADQAEIDAWPNQSQLGKAIPGDLKYRDVNGDGVVSDKDLIPMKYPTVPELNLSYTLNINYKGFDLSVLLQGVSNYSFNFTDRGVREWNGNPARNGWKNYFELHKYAWTPEKAANGGDIRYPRLHVDGISGNHATSNYWLIDLWYLRVKNLELGYTFPKRMTKAIGLENLRVYLNGMNVATFDNMPFKYFDPEVSNSLSHPIFATYNAGLNITF